jgi:hypothetical protein
LAERPRSIHTASRNFETVESAESATGASFVAVACLTKT